MVAVAASNKGVQGKKIAAEEESNHNKVADKKTWCVFWTLLFQIVEPKMIPKSQTYQTKT